ncbi:MAG: hypothetical protein ACR2PX_17635 [Endozoicomonas sp.]
MIGVLVKEGAVIVSSLVVLLFFLSIILLADLFVDTAVPMEQEVVNTR